MMPLLDSDQVLALDFLLTVGGNSAPLVDEDARRPGARIHVR
jgi:hypothetical protein